MFIAKKVPINWCPFCKTGLANEEVLPDGVHERCGHKVTRKFLSQWLMRITDYADRLLYDLDQYEWVDEAGDKHKGLDWPKGILEMQRNWIGKKQGINIHYPVDRLDDEVVCFTTRPDTNFGATFIVLGPEHRLVKKLVDRSDQKTAEAIKAYVKKSLAKTEIDRVAEGRKKTGVFTGFYCQHRLIDQKLPIYVSDFVLGDVGTGAVVGVPGHDKRDFEFAQKFNIEVKRVVVASNGDESPITKIEQVQEDEGTMINSDFLNGMDIHQATQKIMDYYEKKGYGERVPTYHLRDWVFSRQRYWGEPFPLVYCKKCGDENGVVPISEDQLPVELPHLKSYEPTDTGESPLARVEKWVNTACPKCGGPARRETDTMPNWAGSCWYFLAFAKPEILKGKLVSKLTFKDNKWLPVNWYLGGAEHAVLHLLYARFWAKVFSDLDLVDFNEPFLRLRSVGMVLAEDGKKMSKSLGNVVNPDGVVAKFGADALRIYELFMGPWNQVIAWETRALIGCYRFLEKVWRAAVRDLESCRQESDSQLVKKLSHLVAKVDKDIIAVKFNTAVAALMEFTNFWSRSSQGLKLADLRVLLLVLAPLAPHMAEELWQVACSTWRVAGSRKRGK